MRFNRSKLFGKLKAHGRRIAAGVCMLSAAVAVVNVLPGSAALANSPDEAILASSSANLVFTSSIEDAMAIYSPTYYDMEADSVVISKQYSNIHYETETIPGNVTYIDCDYLPAGQKQTVVYGSDTVIQYEVADKVTAAGVESVVLEEKEISTMKDTVILVGTGKSTMSNLAVPFTAQSADAETGIMTVEAAGQTLQVKGVIECRASAYCACKICCGPYARGITSTGTQVKVGSVAVDPRVIPYGTRMFIVSNDGSVVYGYAVAEDCGGAIKSDRIDLYHNTHGEALIFGRKDCTVYILA